MNNKWFETRKACPVCSSDNCNIIYESPYDDAHIKDYLVGFYSPEGMVELEYLDGANYVLRECSVCGLIFQSEVPNDVLTERLYEHWMNPQRVFERHQQQDGLECYTPLAQEIMQIVSHLGKKPASLSFFDFGMGWGKWALMAKAFGCDSYGTELSLNRIEHARENGIKVIDWDEIPQYHFDFINAEQVFEHIPDPLLTLRHLKTALKTDGILKISVPTANDMKRRLKTMDWQAPKGSKNSLNAVAPLEHINFFSRKSLLMMATQAGMEEVCIPLMGQYRYVTDWKRPKRIAMNLFLPIYRNILKKQNYVLFRNIQHDTG